jgi:cytosine/adenosine deaminase-related metal-dependent hydrolase
MQTAADSSSSHSSSEHATEPALHQLSTQQTGYRLLVLDALAWLWDDEDAGSYTSTPHGHLERKHIGVDRRGRFTSVGDEVLAEDGSVRGEVSVDRVIHAEGRVLLPGLIDAHIHVQMTGET